MFVIDEKVNTISLVQLFQVGECVELHIDGECIGYFDDDGLNLLAAEKIKGEFLDADGFLKIVRCKG